MGLAAVRVALLLAWGMLRRPCMRRTHPRKAISAASACCRRRPRAWPTRANSVSSLSRTSPYTNYNVSIQPLPWLEGSFRYTNVSNRLYGPRSLSGNQTYKDKSIDGKVRLWEESRWLPTVAVGARDIGGTGLFSSEYVVASKRAGPFDVSLGLAWGYMGAAATSPIRWTSSAIASAIGPRRGTGTGKFSTNSFFRGRPGFFGGVQYQSPWHWLLLKAELDGNDYKHQPQNNNQPQRWPINLGAVFRLNRYVDLTLGYERGEIATAALNLHANLATQAEAPKLSDPAPEPLAGKTATAAWMDRGQRPRRRRRMPDARRRGRTLRPA